ncbi:TIGR02234 family membrane protein [Corynebacterium lubricantis]|uniref:TIGR02234 family membrane protein n=1 Tax=Corynebacterium lubricantis TaxID=541095 RepID=UPI000368287E|nr:TIGR02234 family membrane protein [Corynebacterium lubricantis]
MSEQKVDKGLSRQGALALGIGALIMWAGSRMTWLSVSYFDDRSGSGTIDLTGAVWSTEVTAVILLLLAGMIAGFVVRKWGRRIIGAISALAAIGAMVSPLSLFFGTPDTERAHSLLTSGAASQRASNPVSIAEWASITDISVSFIGPVLIVVGALIAVAGGLAMAARPGGDSPKLNKYETAAMRREKLHDDLESTPDSGRVMWDALDADIDPTDREPKKP